MNPNFNMQGLNKNINMMNQNKINQNFNNNMIGPQNNQQFKNMNLNNMSVNQNFAMFNNNINNQGNTKNNMNQNFNNNNMNAMNNNMILMNNNNNFNGNNNNNMNLMNNNNNFNVNKNNIMNMNNNINNVNNIKNNINGINYNMNLNANLMNNNMNNQMNNQNINSQMNNMRNNSVNNNIQMNNMGNNNINNQNNNMNKNINNMNNNVNNMNYNNTNNIMNNGMNNRNYNPNNQTYNNTNNQQNNFNNIQNNMNCNYNNNLNKNNNMMNIQNNVNNGQNMNNKMNIPQNNVNFNNSNLIGIQNNNFNPMTNMNNQKNNMGFQFMQNFSGFKVDFSVFNNINQNNNKQNIINNNYNDIMANKEAESFANEIENISKKLNDIFRQEELKNLMNEKDLLKFFVEKEEELLNYVDQYFGGEPYLKNFTNDEIKRIFEENPIINRISIIITIQINDIPINQMSSEKELYIYLGKIFKDMKLPKFLIKGPLQNLKSILFYSNRTSETTTIINNIHNKKISTSSILLNAQLDKIKQNPIFILEGINFRYELIYLFISINSVGLKTRFWLKFLNFLQLNEPKIKYFFSQNFNHTEIFKDFQNMDEQARNAKIQNFFLVIEGYVNNENIIYSIIASFYDLLFYQFKTSENPQVFSNIGNPYLNLCLKNFVIFLDQKFKDRFQFGDNLYELLKELYISDVNYLVKNNFYAERNNLYDFFYIDSVLSKNDKVKESYEDLKKKYSSEGGLFTRIQNKLHLGEGRDFTTFEKYIKLINCDEFIFTNTITIIIDGFTTEENNPMDNWKNFVNYFKRESMFYYYKWPSDSSKNIISRGIGKALRFASQSFSSASERAKICGKILAYIIFSNEIFKNFQINLIGFSLGNHVIKHCIKELSRLNELYRNQNYEINLKNVILVAAATRYKHIDSWIKYSKETIVDKFKNCYSKVDRILQYLYGLCMMKTAIGRDELIIMDGNKNMVENFDFTQDNFGHMSYKMGVVAERISGYYKEL